MLGTRKIRKEVSTGLEGSELVHCDSETLLPVPGCPKEQRTDLEREREGERESELQRLKSSPNCASTE